MIPRGRIRKESVFSTEMNQERKFEIYLPSQYSRRGIPILNGTTLAYPVIYFLHNYFTDPSKFRDLYNWLDQEIYHRRIPPVIAVLPDGSVPFYAGSMFVDSDAFGRVQSFIVNELVPIVEDRFFTERKAQYRAVIGYGMGGYGALRLAWEYPNVFATAAAHSPPTDFNWTNAALHEVRDARVLCILTRRPSKRVSWKNLVRNWIIAQQMAHILPFCTLNQVLLVN